MAGRYSHAHQLKRARRALKFLNTRLGRVIRDINRKVKGQPELEARRAPLRDPAVKVRHQDHRQRGPKVYSLHAPEVECIGKGKARTPYEFGCKVSIVTPVTTPKGGQFVLHAKALHGNPFDGHTIGPIVADLEKLTGVEPRRIHVDKGYRGHPHPNKFRVWISGQVRRVTAVIHREMKRRAAIEPVIGHVKIDRGMDSQLSQGSRGRSRQRYPGRRRLQLPQAPPLARGAFACLVPDTRLQLPTAIHRLKSCYAGVLHG
jgi:IS5 family transposase